MAIKLGDVETSTDTQSDDKGNYAFDRVRKVEKNDDLQKAIELISQELVGHSNWYISDNKAKGKNAFSPRWIAAKQLFEELEEANSEPEFQDMVDFLKKHGDDWYKAASENETYKSLTDKSISALVSQAVRYNII